MGISLRTFIFNPKFALADRSSVLIIGGIGDRIKAS